MYAHTPNICNKYVIVQRKGLSFNLYLQILSTSPTFDTLILRRGGEALKLNIYMLIKLDNQELCIAYNCNVNNHFFLFTNKENYFDKQKLCIKGAHIYNRCNFQE